MSTLQNTTVGAYDARSRFAELLERVERGDEFTITKHGSPVARLIPFRKSASTQDRRAVVAQMRLLAAKNRLDGLRIKDLIAEGRR